MKTKIFQQLGLLLCALILIRTPSVSAENAGEVKIGLVTKALSNPFFAGMIDGAKKEAKKSNVSLEVFGIERETDVERQIALLDALVDRNFQAIILTPADSIRLIPAVVRAIKKGVVIINVDNPLDPKELKKARVSVPFIGPDNRAGARLVGTYIVNLIDQKGEMVVLEGIRGVG